MALTFACSLALALPLYLWQTLYPQSDWAALALLPLAMMIFVGSQKVALARRQAELTAILLPGSGLNRWLKGRIAATLSATLLTVITVPLLASKTLTARAPELFVLTLLCVSTFFIFELLHRKLAGHVQHQFLPTFVTNLSVLITGSFCFPIYTWMSWSLTPIPGHFRSAGFSDAMLQGLTTLPERSGWITELLSLIVTLENAKLWLFVNLGNNPVLLLVYVIYAATLCFVIARGVVAISALYRLYTSP
jgi:hypothetical protein